MEKKCTKTEKTAEKLILCKSILVYQTFQILTLTRPAIEDVLFQQFCYQRGRPFHQLLKQITYKCSKKDYNNKYSTFAATSHSL